MVKLTSSPYFKSFLVTLIVLSFGSIGVLAVMSPECSHCTLVIASKAMLGAKFLASGWIIAGLLFSWDSRMTISEKLRVIRFWNPTAKSPQA